MLHILTHYGNAFALIICSTTRIRRMMHHINLCMYVGNVYHCLKEEIHCSPYLIMYFISIPLNIIRSLLYRCSLKWILGTRIQSSLWDENFWEHKNLWRDYYIVSTIILRMHTQSGSCNIYGSSLVADTYIYSLLKLWV